MHILILTDEEIFSLSTLLNFQKNFVNKNCQSYIEGQKPTALESLTDKLDRIVSELILF